MTIWWTNWITHKKVGLCFAMLCLRPMGMRGYYEITLSLLKQYNYQIAYVLWVITSFLMTPKEKPKPNKIYNNKHLCSWFTLVYAMTVVKKEILKSQNLTETHTAQKKERRTTFLDFLLIQVAIVYTCLHSEGLIAS